MNCSLRRPVMQHSSDRIGALAAALAKVVRSPAVQQKFASVGTLPKASTTAEFDVFLKAEYARWGKVVAESGIKAD